MTDWLVKRTVRDFERTGEPRVRAAYGTLASVTGVICNLFLALCKLLMGVMTGSLAIMADAANNFSDAGGSVVSLASVRLAQKPIDREHPFGHGRMEYIGTLGVGVLIVMLGIRLLSDGVQTIFAPKPVTASWLVIALLVGSMLLKLWLYFFYRKLGDATENSTLLAAGKDSLSDVAATGAVLFSIALQWALGWSADGWMSALVALFVLKTGYSVCRDTVDRLLGEKPDAEKIRQIKRLLLSYDGILGVHDLVLHDYGPGRCIASVHAEVSAKGDIVAVHELIDKAEREIAQALNMSVCIHMDPIVTDDEHVNDVHGKMQAFLRRMDDRLSMHDFRIVPGKEKINLVFDCLLPGDYGDCGALLRSIQAYAKQLDPRYAVIVQFDTDFS